MIDTVPAWLFQDVPLWAFVLALLTRPSTWSSRATAALESRLGGDA